MGESSGTPPAPSIVCPSCGAPISGLEEKTCPFCGASLQELAPGAAEVKPTSNPIPIYVAGTLMLFCCWPVGVVMMATMTPNLTRQQRLIWIAVCSLPALLVAIWVVGLFVQGSARRH